MATNQMTCDIRVLEDRETGLLVAISDQLTGLYVVARTTDDLAERIPKAIRSLLEAQGYRVSNVCTGADEAVANAGFDSFSYKATADIEAAA